MDLSRITEYLYIAAHPKAEDADAILALNVHLIINMLHQPAAEVYSRPPFQLVELGTYDSYIVPIPVNKLVQGVEAALPVIQGGDPVLIYCREGRHRSVAMSSAVLIAMGYSAEEAMKLIKERRKKADPDAWHIRRVIKKFEKTWNNLTHMKKVTNV